MTEAAADANGWVVQAAVYCWVLLVVALRSCGGSGEGLGQGEKHAATSVDASHCKATFVEARTGEVADLEAGLEAALPAALSAVLSVVTKVASTGALMEIQWAVPAVAVVAEELES